MHARSLTVLGGGNTGFAVAANLTLGGCSVTLCELPAFRDSIEPILHGRQIVLDGVARRGMAQIDIVTTDFAEALSANDLVLVIVPAYGHRAFAEASAPHLRPGQVVVLMPGTLGSLEFARILRDRRSAEGVVLAETDTAPYVCRKLAPSLAHIWGVVSGLGLAVLPAAGRQRVAELVEAGFGPRGDLWATINGSRMLTQLRAPGSLESRWLTEDVPYGLATWVELGRQLGVNCPILSALVDLASAATGVNFWEQARTLNDLGLAGLDKEALLDYLLRGRIGRPS